MTAMIESRGSRDAGRPPLIAHVIFRLDTGGLENGLVNLLNNMPADRYRHAIICLTEFTEFSKRIESPDVEVIALHKAEGKDLGIYLRLWRTFRRLRPDVVHTRNLGTVDAVIPALLAGVRCRVHGEHGWDVTDLHGTNRRYRWLRRVCSLFTHRHIAVSRNLADWLRDSVRIPQRKIRQIYNGVDTDRFNPGRRSRKALFEGEGVSETVIVIGTVGRLAAVKNPIALVKAFATMVSGDSAAAGRLRLVLIGDGPLRDEVHAAVTDAGIDDLVWLAGDRRDVAHLLAGFDVFVMPSLNEGISNTILEAMASGLPVVATDVGGNPELVEAGVTGQLVVSSDTKALVRGIGEYVESADLRTAHGSAGRMAAEQRFSLRSMVGGYLNMYDELVYG